ncbi:hypothetical protein RB195_012311 [Necator americanus]|uniref:Zasp-like motif domain-containing protein n=1 Tax=Necator americanus TaxID=51031 RepID=A0ABR1D6G6_NECAM
MRVQSVYSPAGNTTYSEVTGTDGNKRLHRPGIEPGPPAWQASILPLNHRCVSKVSTALQETPHIQWSQEQMGTTSETRVSILPLNHHACQSVYSRGNTTYSEVKEQWNKKNIASAGNRTRAARVAGEHSTTEPPIRVQNVYSPAGNTTYSEVTGTDGNNIRNSRIKHCIGRESNPGRPRGRRAFYH